MSHINGESKEESRPLRRGIQKKLILAGVIQLMVFFAIIFLYLPFLMNELRRDIVAQRQLAERLKEKEVETIARFLAFELGRMPVLNDLKSAYFSPGTRAEADIEEMMASVAKILWEKCAFSSEIVYMDLLSCVGDSVLIVAPYGKEASSAYFDEAEIEQAKSIFKLTPVASPAKAGGEYIRRYLMPLYVEGSRWGVARIVISTEDFKAIDANVADREEFKQTSFVVFALTTVIGFGVGLLVFSYCARQVSEPLNRLTAAMQRFGHEQDFERLLGDLAKGGTPAAGEEDEVGLLKEAFTEMAHRLQATMSRLRATIGEKEEAVADREKALVELRESERALQESAKLATLGEIGASFAHEINNKLQPAKITAVSLLEGEGDPKVARHDLEGILLSINDCARYVDKFKTFARPQHRVEDDVDVNAVIEDVLDLIEKPLQKVKVNVKKDFTEGLPHVAGDSSELAQVLMNLLFNARDAIEPTLTDPKRCGTITVRTYRDADGVHVEVGDDGMGMSKEVLSKLFTPFFTTKGLARGTGLGLSISKAIMDAHRGRIDVQSLEGQGTTFRLTFPLRQGADG